MGRDNEKSDINDSIFDQYVRHSDVLRNWYVAFGIGGLVLYLSNQSTFSNFPKDQLVLIAILLISGVIFQVILAFVNKVYNFLFYHKSIRSKTTATADEIKKNKILFFVVDFPLDVLTIGAFAWATYELFNILFIIAA